MTTQELLKVFKSLDKDIKHAIQKLNETDENFDFYARSYVRALAGWVEGTVWIYKKIITHLPNVEYKNLPLEYQLFLFDHDWNIKSSGEPQIRVKKISTTENLKGFLFVMKQIYPEFDVDFNEKNFSCLLSMFKIRDRIMHPTSIDSLVINKRELNDCEKGREWLSSKLSIINGFIDKSCA